MWWSEGRAKGRATAAVRLSSSLAFGRRGGGESGGGEGGGRKEGSGGEGAIGGGERREVHEEATGWAAWG